MFRQNPVFLVAGEIVRTSRIFAMSVSPLTRTMLDKINPTLFEKLMAFKKKDNAKKETAGKKTSNEKKIAKQQKKIAEEKGDNTLSLGDFLFETKKIKGKKTAILPIEQFSLAVLQEKNKSKLSACGDMKGKIITRDNGTLLNGEKMSLIINVVKSIDLAPLSEKKWNRNMNANIYDQLQKEQLIDSLDWLLRTSIAKNKGREYGFIALFTDGKGNYWFKVSRGFMTALTESHSSLETLIDEPVEFNKEEKKRINSVISLVNKLYD